MFVQQDAWEKLFGTDPYLGAFQAPSLPSQKTSTRPGQHHPENPE